MMKKTRILIFLSSLLAFSSSAMAEIGLSVDLGYEADAVVPSFGVCWSECLDEGEPAGIALGISWEVIGVPGMYIAFDIADLEDEGDIDTGEVVTITQERNAFEIGYKYNLNPSTKLTAGIVRSDITWEWKWTAIGTRWSYEAEDDGISLILGAEKVINNELDIGVAYYHGFETGIEIFAFIHLTEQLSVKADYSIKSYEAEFVEYNNLGLPTGFSSANGDGDFEFDTTAFRLSASYAF